MESVVKARIEGKAQAAMKQKLFCKEE